MANIAALDLEYAMVRVPHSVLRPRFVESVWTTGGCLCVPTIPLPLFPPFKPQVDPET